MLLARLAILVALPGCFLTHSDPPCVMTGADTVIMSWGSDALHDTTDGSIVPLVSAPQGGQIMLIGARTVATVDRCAVTINAALRDPANNRVIGLEQRDLVIGNRGDGWAEPLDWMMLSGLANLPVCPTTVATKPIDGNTFQLEVRLSIGSKVISERTASIVPTCSSSYCHTDCTTGGL
ncbi:MAG: hypothetical protein JWO36_5475 [Myxococcales bacterium]|nr:hypothetical protein [Myxococcales bacterium]